MSIAAAFLGGMLFAILVAIGSIWWTCRDMKDDLPGDCAHCYGTGLGPIEDAAEPPSEVPEDPESMK